MKTKEIYGKPNKISDLPNGSVVCYRGKPYFISHGLTTRIVTGTNGIWQCLNQLKWKTFTVVYVPNQRGVYEN